MLVAVPAVAATAAATAAYFATKGDASRPVDLDEEPEVIEAPTLERRATWKETSGRKAGKDGYVFGDVSRGVVCRVFGNGKAEDLAAEEQGDDQFTQVQRLLREAIRLYRARGYSGSISMAQTVAYFNESASVKVDGPGKGEKMPWERPKTAADESVEALALSVTNEAIAAALCDAPPGEDSADSAERASEAAEKQIAKEGQAGLVFATLLARLERRAKSWQALSGVEALDPALTQSAHIGFAIPVIKLGWGVSVSLTVSASSLLRWAEHEAATAVA